MNEQESLPFTRALERIGMILGAIYAASLGEGDQKEKARRLRYCGFSNTEIAKLIGSTPGAVAVALHRTRGGKSKKSRSRR
jgi:hypothetical protein